MLVAVMVLALIVPTVTAPVTDPTDPLTDATAWLVLIVVPDRLTVVVGDPILAKSIPASPVEDTSSLRPAVVGYSAAWARSVNRPTEAPTTDIESTVPAVITASNWDPSA